MSEPNKPLLDAIGRIFKKLQGEIDEVRRADRGLTLMRTVNELRIEESLAALREWVHSVAHEKSKLVEARAMPAAPWLASLDEGGRES